MLVRGNGSVVFNDEITVLLGEGTRVTRQLDSGQHDIDEISVGQRVMVFGTLNGDAGEGRVLDATEGQVRMVLTTLMGTVVQADGAAQELVLDLSSIGRHRIDRFDFSGTGSDSSQDADPDNYQVATAALDLDPFAPGKPVKVRGRSAGDGCVARTTARGRWPWPLSRGEGWCAGVPPLLRNRKL